MTLNMIFCYKDTISTAGKKKKWNEVQRLEDSNVIMLIPDFVGYITVM